MGAQTDVPRPPLSDFVDKLWAYEAYGEGHARERVLPTATCELVVDLSAGAAVVCGAHSEAFVIDVAARPRLVGVHFKPGGAFTFLSMPVTELQNARVPLEATRSLFSTTAREGAAECRAWRRQRSPPRSCSSGW